MKTKIAGTHYYVAHSHFVYRWNSPMKAITQPVHSAVEQQTHTVTGTVTDATGPVIGASVIEKEILPTEPSPT